MKVERKNSVRRSMKLSIPGIAVLLILTTIAAISLAVVPAAAQPVEVTVNAPEYVDVGGTFTVTIGVDSVTEFNTAQFDLSFDPDVVKISEIKKGEINGEEFPTFMHRSVAEDTERVLASMPFGKGVSGSGYLAEIEFKAKGEVGEKSELNLSKGMLGNISAGKISAEWISSEIKIGEEKEEEGEEEEEEIGEEVIPGSPNVTAWNPVEAVVNNTEDEPRTFNITIDQIAAISWQINGTEVQTNETVTEAVFTKSADIGTWNVSAIAISTTTGLSDTHTWIWCVTATATVTPTPTEVVGEIPPAETEAEGTPTPTVAPRVTPKPTAPPTEKNSTPAATPKPAVPGFEAVFAIAVMLAIAYILQRRGESEGGK